MMFHVFVFRFQSFLLSVLASSIFVFYSFFQKCLCCAFRCLLRHLLNPPATLKKLELLLIIGKGGYVVLLHVCRLFLHLFLTHTPSLSSALLWPFVSVANHSPNVTLSHPYTIVHEECFEGASRVLPCVLHFAFLVLVILWIETRSYSP